MFSPAMENLKMLRQEKENKLHIILIAFTISLEIYQKKYEVFSDLGQKTKLGCIFHFCDAHL